MAQTTVSVAATGKHALAPPTANKLAGTPEKRGGAVPPPPRQVLGTGTQQAWRSRLPVPVKRTPGGGTATKGTAIKGATATGLPNFPTPPRSTSGGISKLPVPTRKTPGGANRLPVVSLKTRKDATGTPRKPAGTSKAPPVPCQAPRKGAPPAGDKVSQSGKRFSQSGNGVSEMKTKAKFPTPSNVSKPANDTARKLASGHICIPPKPKPSSVSLRRSPHSPTKVRGTAGAAAEAQRQNRQPPPTQVPATVITTVITPAAPVVVPMTPVVPPRVFVPLPSTYHPGVKFCEGESLNPLPTDLQKAAGAIYLERRRHKLAPKPGRNWQTWLPKLTVAPGEYCKKKPPPGPSPLKQCLSEEGVVTRRKIIRVKGKVVAPHLGPGGRPRTLKDPPLVIALHRHRTWLMLQGGSAWWSPWWGYLRAWQDGQQ